MLFHSLPFVLVFLPLCLVSVGFVRRWGGVSAALGVLTAASLVFYAWWNPIHLPLLVGSILANRALGARIFADARWFVPSVVANLALLGWFKYAGLFLGVDDPPALPLAISFFTFQQIMFLATCRDRPPPRWLPYAAFVAFFPHLIAGPLVRPADIVPQLAKLQPLRRSNILAGLELFLLGLAKKLVLADMFGPFADVGFGAAERGETLTLLEAWAATLSYALQIYFDFSGYSDMATGIARMFGIGFPLNFDSPYKATDISAFWRRWHITLGAFLRDHVYVPLGGNRLGLSRELGALMATMLLAGLWHGAAWRFVVWGGLHGAMLAAHRLWRRAGLSMPDPAGRAITLCCVCIAWVPFRADSTDAIWAMLRGLSGMNGIALPTAVASAIPWFPASSVPVLRFLGDARTLSVPEVAVCLTLGWAIALLCPHAQALTERGRAWVLTGSFALTVRAAVFAPHVAPFLYFQF